MSVLAGIIGSGAGLVVIAAAFLLSRHAARLPAGVQPFLGRAAVILMFAGGSALAVTALGGYADRLVSKLAGLVPGGLSAGLPHAALVITALVLAAGVIIGVIYGPSGRDEITAVILPLVLGLVPGGILHSAYAAVVVPAGSWAAGISAWIGG